MATHRIHLEQVVDLSEANGLLRTASRAHINLSYFLHLYLIDLNSAHRHSLRAVEILQQMGDLESLRVPHSNAFISTLNLDELKLAEQIFSEAFSASIKLGSLMEYYFKLNRAQLLLAKGEWKLALGVNRILLEELQQGSSFQRDSTESLMPYSRLTWASLFCSVSISNTTRALNSGENLRRCIILDPFPGV